MKKISIIALFVAFVCVSCVKERTCGCTATEVANASQELLTVDGSINCEDVTTMGFDEMIGGEYVTSVQKVNCVELSVKK